MSSALEMRKAALASDPQGRLRWRIFSAFGILPGEPRASALDDQAIIDCAIHMILDRNPLAPSGELGNFDMAEFLRQQGGIDHGTQ